MSDEKVFTLGEAVAVTGKDREFFDEKVRAELTKNGATIVARGRGTKIPASALTAIGLEIDESRLTAAAGSARRGPVEVKDGETVASLEKDIEKAEGRIATAREQIAQEERFIKDAKAKIKVLAKVESKNAEKARKLKEKAEALLAEAEALTGR